MSENDMDCGPTVTENRTPSVRMPKAMYRVDSGPPPDSWPSWRRMFGAKAYTYRSKGHAINRANHLQHMGYADVAVYESQVDWRDITPSRTDNVECRSCHGEGKYRNTQDGGYFEQCGICNGTGVVSTPENVDFP